jgi:hypothetical protein
MVTAQKNHIFALPLRATGNYVFLSNVKCVTEQLFLSLFLGKESRDNKKIYIHVFWT